MPKKEEISEFKKFRMDRLGRYNQLSHEDKILVAEMGYKFSLDFDDINQAKNNLYRVIELIFEKIKSKYCK